MSDERDWANQIHGGRRLSKRGASSCPRRWAMADEALHLLHAPMRIERLMQLGRDRGMPITGVDLGYAIHMAFGELFDEEAPSVFAIDQQRRG
ncbi:MAG: hypothetical protein R3F65_31965 [bacterium]